MTLLVTEGRSGNDIVIIVPCVNEVAIGPAGSRLGLELRLRVRG